jgi:hypothetical protein
MTSFARLLVLSALLISFSSVAVMGQDSTKSSIQTVFKKKKGIAKLNYLGVYIAPEYQFGQVGGVFRSLAGGSVMLQFNKRFAVGISGYSSLRNQSMGVDGKFGGLKFEYTVKPDAAIHVSFPLIVGMASNNFHFEEYEHDDFRDERDDDYDQKAGNKRRRDDRFSNTTYHLIQPGIMAEANLYRFAKAFVGANYRFAFDNNGLNTDYKGFSVNLGVKLGIFDYAINRKPKKKKNEIKF